MLKPLLFCLTVVVFAEHLQTAHSLVRREYGRCASHWQAQVIHRDIAKLAEEVAFIKFNLNNKQKVVVSSRSCPQGWSEYKSSCYIIIDRPTKKWQDARKTCQNLGGDLVKISSAGENTFIFQLATKTSKSFLWIGFFRGAHKAFHWIDGSLLSGSYSNWNGGEPSNSGGNEDCGEMFLKIQGRWNDIPCVNSRNAVIACEKQK